MSFLCSLVFLLLRSLSFPTTTAANLTCSSYHYCSDCIQHIGCLWCLDPEPGYSKCQSTDLAQCISSGSTINPKSFAYVIENETFSSSMNRKNQIRPQRVHVHLRPNDSHRLHFQYRQAENYPIDIYYLMDMSASMEHHREKLAKLAYNLADTMTRITDDLRLGFGTFVDKVDLPFVSTSPSKLIRPCTLYTKGAYISCNPPYTYRNHMSLTAHFSDFANAIDQAAISGNLDAPEATLDALMQSIVCKEEIGWRKNARHLLVVSTDGEYHVAGDGKLAGIVQPNDGKCHMHNNSYAHALLYDYPSVSQVNHMARLNNINIIFAVANKTNIYETYRLLSEEIENSNVGVLDDNSENVISLVLENYNKIVDSVVMASNASSSDIEINISSSCQHPIANGCSNIHIGEVVNFTVDIRAVGCTSTNITIKPNALEDALEIDANVMCSCHCSDVNLTDSFLAGNCSGMGHTDCDQCRCVDGRSGDNCECDANVSLDACHGPNDKLCSGLGLCLCGQCHCDKRPNHPEELIYGDYCECDNYSCARVDDRLCAGNGRCECGRCNCSEGWSGDSCDCRVSNSTCTNHPTNNMVCSGKGDCICGQCQCHSDAVRYTGVYCEQCPSCSEERCVELQSCVLCLINGISQEEACVELCNGQLVLMVDRLSEDHSFDSRLHQCSSPMDQSGCTLRYGYYLDEQEQLIVRSERNKYCQYSITTGVWVIKFVVSIVVAGLIIIVLWKMVVIVHDRREYAVFEDEVRSKLKWSREANPLYQDAN